MGYTNWSTDFYHDRKEERARSGKSAFEYHDAVKTGKARREVHASMNPVGAVRESRDSDKHPNSVAIIIGLDVTGSMSQTPMAVQAALPELMDTIIQDAGIPDPQILVSAIGDFYSDRAPFQVGQFESGIEIENDLGHMYMEGGGGGSYEESYENLLYFAARKTHVDCHEKRNQKGYLFIVGDEHPYPHLTKRQAKEVFGDDLQEEISVEDLVAEAREKFHIFFILPLQTNHGRDPALRRYWEKLLGDECVLQMEDGTEINRTVAGAIKAHRSGETYQPDLRNARL